MKHVGLAWKRNGYQSERLPIPRSQPRSSFRPRRCSSVLRCPDLSDGVPEWFRGSSVVSLPDILRVLDFKQAESTGVPPPISATVRPFIRFRHLSLMGCSILVHHPRSANSRSISPDFHIRFPPFPIVSSWPSPPERACPVCALARRTGTLSSVALSIVSAFRNFRTGRQREEPFPQPPALPQLPLTTDYPFIISSVPDCANSKGTDGGDWFRIPPCTDNICG
jgi:hypothetical protein